MENQWAPGAHPRSLMIGGLPNAASSKLFARRMALHSTSIEASAVMLASNASANRSFSRFLPSVIWFR